MQLPKTIKGKNKFFHSFGQKPIVGISSLPLSQKHRRGLASRGDPQTVDFVQTNVDAILEKMELEEPNALGILQVVIQAWMTRNQQQLGMFDYEHLAMCAFDTLSKGFWQRFRT